MGKTELTEKFDRRENLRGTALTIMGGIFWGTGRPYCVWES